MTARILRHSRCPPLRSIVFVRLPDSNGVQWGAWLLDDGGYTYVYGIEDLGLGEMRTWRGCKRATSAVSGSDPPARAVGP